MIVQLNVTQEMIDNSLPNSCDFGPVAQSFLSVLKPECWVTVNGFRCAIRTTTPAADTEFTSLPIGVRSWIGRYDEFGRVPPFSFIVHIPRRFLNDRAIRENTVQGSYTQEVRQ